MFYNWNERRLRAAWRLLIQGLLFLIFLALSTAALSLAYFVILGVTGKISTQVSAMRVLQGLSGSLIPELAGQIFTLVCMTISLWIAARLLDHRPFRDFGFHLKPAWWRDLGFGLALGALLMAVIFGIEWAAGWVRITAFLFTPTGLFPINILIAAVGYTCVGIYEELFSRGYQLRNLAEGLHLPGINPSAAVLLAYLVSSMIFGSLHAANPNATLISTLNLMLAGLFLGLGFILTGELAISIGLHIAWNFFEGNVFGFPVSGSLSSVSILAIQQGGPQVWTGGAFGPEAGLVGLLALALGSLLIVLWVRSTRGKAKAQSRLAEYLRPNSYSVHGPMRV